jgi:hypothetical protein
MAVGRISGQMLKSNLVRDGVDLAFETDLLYLDVVNSRIGVNKSSPLHDLDVNGTTKTTDLEVTNQFDIGNITVTGNTISSDLSTITFAPSGAEPTIYNARLIVDDIQILGNTISTEVSNSALELRANGTGIIDIYGNTNITGNLDVTGNINATGNVVIGGNITIGDALTDTIEIIACIRRDLIPETDNTYDLGSASFRWGNVYANNVYADTYNYKKKNDVATFHGNWLTQTEKIIKEYRNIKFIRVVEPSAFIPDQLQVDVPNLKHMHYSEFAEIYPECIYNSETFTFSFSSKRWNMEHCTKSKQ